MLHFEEALQRIMINAKFVSIVFLLIYSTTTSALQCYSCQNVPDKRDCHRLVTCDPHETCYTNHVTDSVKSPTYNLGCQDQYACSQHSQSGLGKREINRAYQELANGSSDHKRAVQTTCSQCCNSTDGCNLNICGQVPQTRRRCLSCRDVLKPSDCDQIADCSLDEFCYVHKGINPNIASYESRYDFGCMGSMQCSALAIIYPQSCLKCCNNTDFCNLDACNGWKPATLHPPTTLMTTAATTTTVSTHIVINGPTKVHNTESTTLTCVTNPPAQSYSWKFNGRTTLPNGAKVLPVSTYPGSAVGINTLLITNVSASAVGIYTCVAYSNGYIVERSHSLGIIAASGFTTNNPTTTTTAPTTPRFMAMINGPDKSNYTHTTQLTCVTSPPAQSYTWKFNGTDVLPKGITTQQSITQAGSVAGIDILHIQNLMEAQLGTYTCIATFNGQTVEQSHSLGINGEKPTVHIEKPPVTLSFALQCRTTGYPVPSIKWDFVPDASAIHGVPPGVEFSDTKFLSTLFVKSYNPTDHMGMWYCKASNVFGISLAKVHIP